MDKVKKLLKGELIGRQIRLERLSDGKNLTGKIIDETKNTIILKTGSQEKRLIKALYAFEFDVEGKKLRIVGKQFLKRPEERIKSKMMKEW
jgi:ribonuclease P protein subunit POP4